MSGGYTGKTLEINLSSRTVNIIPTPPQDIALYLGGRGLGVKLLTDRLQKAGVDAFSPDNPLILATAPLSGIPIAGPARTLVVTKAAATSPSQRSTTGASTITYSAIGGRFGPELKFAGYDALIISGRSDSPVIIVIDDDKIVIRDARALWGKKADVTLDTLQTELGPDFQCLAIGPAGENKVLFANILSDVRRSSARGGSGAVMGSKNLKAIAVHGSNVIPVADHTGLMQMRLDITTSLSTWLAYPHWRRWGTSPLLLSSDKSGTLATRNFRSGSWDMIDRLAAPIAEREFWARSQSCWQCPLKCIKIGQITDGPYRGTIAEGPGYSAGAALGSNCGISDLSGLMKLIAVVDELGMDASSAGNIIGFSMDLFADGILTRSDLSGINLAWGNVPAAIELLELIASRQGIGAVLAEGVKKAAVAIGPTASQYAMHVKGQEMSGWNPIGNPGHAISQGTSNRGAGHQDGLNADEQNRRAFLDSLAVCRFVASGTGTAPYQKAYTLAVDQPLDDAAMLKAGERIWNLEKLFNVREGFGRVDDEVPARLIAASEQKKRLDDYYRSRGWDIQSGEPLTEKLQSLGLQRL